MAETSIVISSLWHSIFHSQFTTIWLDLSGNVILWNFVQNYPNFHVGGLKQCANMRHWSYFTFSWAIFLIFWVENYCFSSKSCRFSAKFTTWRPDLPGKGLLQKSWQNMSTFTSNIPNNAELCGIGVIFDFLKPFFRFFSTFG